MWVSPKHPSPPKKSAAPVDRGRRLATCDRHDGELRVSLDEYNEHPYISIRLWERDKQTGELWPSKKGVSVRLGEIGDVIAGLRHLEELIDRGEVQLPRRGRLEHGQHLSPMGDKQQEPSRPWATNAPPASQSPRQQAPASAPAQRPERQPDRLTGQQDVAGTTKGVIQNHTLGRTQSQPLAHGPKASQGDDRPQFVDKRRQGPRQWSPPPSGVPRSEHRLGTCRDGHRACKDAETAAGTKRGL